MAAESELRKWLNRPDKDFLENLECSIKLWNSVEFMLISKYEIITEEFSKNVCITLKEVRKSIADDPSRINDLHRLWNKINEFLQLKQPSTGSLSTSVKDVLVNVIKSEVKKTRKNPDRIIFQGLLLIFKNQSLQSYYKSNLNVYCNLIGEIFKYFSEYINMEMEQSQCKPGLNDIVTLENQTIIDLFNDLKSFIKQTPYLDEFRKIFSRETLNSFTEFYLLLKNHENQKQQQQQQQQMESEQNHFTNEYFEIIQQIYFDGSTTDMLKEFFENSTITNISENIFQQLFTNVENHITLLLIESILIIFKNDDELQKQLFKFLFKKYFTKLMDSHRSSTMDSKYYLNSLNFLINLFKKYNLKLNFEIDLNIDDAVKADSDEILKKSQKSKRVIQFLGEFIEKIVNNYYENNLYEILILIREILQLNPLILEQRIFNILVKCMLIEDKTLEIMWEYECVWCLVIDMFRKLSRAEKMINYLIRSLTDHMKSRTSSTVVSIKNKNKRHINEISEQPVKQTPKKKFKLENHKIIDVNDDNNDNNNNNRYLNILFYNLFSKNTFDSNNKKQQNNIDNDWQTISFVWSDNIGIEFSKCVTSLVSKPSTVVWKAIVFTLTSHIQTLKTDIINTTTNINNGLTKENSLFLIELLCALLSQYFIGCRLIEHADKIWHSIQSNYQLTIKLLTEFGSIILGQEHNKRIMNAFLQICYNFGNFQLLLQYYCPDSMELPVTAFKNIHSYLTEKQWILIEQRITNFGKKSCKRNINKLFIQRNKSIYFEDNLTNNLSSSLILSATNVFENKQQILSILSDSTLNLWFLVKLTKQQLYLIVDKILNKYSNDMIIDGEDGEDGEELIDDDDEYYHKIIELIRKNQLTREFIEIFSLKIFQYLTYIVSGGGDDDDVRYTNDQQNNIKDEFKPIFKKSQLKLVNFKKLFQNELQFTELIEIISKIKINKILRKKSEINIHKDIEYLMEVLECLPIGFISKTIKNYIFLLNLLFYCDLLVININIDSNNIAATGLISKCFNLFKGLIKFGEVPDEIFQHLDITVLLDIFQTVSDSDLYEFYKIFFERIVNHLNENNCNIFKRILNLLNGDSDKHENLTDRILDISLIAVECLSTSKEKLNKELYEEFRESLLKKIRNYFAQSNDNQDDQDKLYVQRTLSGFSAIVNVTLLKCDASKSIDEDFIKICKIYIFYSINCQSQYSLKLMNASLNHKTILNFTDNEVRVVIDKYWQDVRDTFKMECNNGNVTYPVNVTMEAFLKIILDNKSIVEIFNLLQDIEEEIQQDIGSFCMHHGKFLQTVAKCQLNKSKGSLFSEYFRQIAFKITMELNQNKILSYKDLSIILTLLNCQQVIISNYQIPIAIELIDDVLGFIGQLNIKQFIVTIDSQQNFYKLHNLITDLCHALIQHRHFFILDRIPQFIAILKDLLQAICWFKSPRQNVQNLDGYEIKEISELSHKIENIVKILVKYAKDFKLIAPYFLIFIINLMISNDRPTTLYPKIKMYFENICYDIISICDHRVNGFILRSCNDAGKQLYEILMKDYNKYRKFKGKI